MIVNKADIVAVAVKKEQYPPADMAEIAFAGRSNVGKSSLLNLVTGRRKLAKVSGAPGKTRTINFYEINGSFRIVDLPGYGFAVKLSEEEKRRWDALMGTYLTSSPRLKLVLVLMDIRREPSALDKQMINYLSANIVPFVVVLTKADKLSRAAAGRQKSAIASALKLGVDNILITSSLNKQGKDEVCLAIEKYLNE